MAENGDFIVTHFQGKPDMWNTKPPLLNWFQVFFIKLIGVNEISIRLPSALAAFFTCMALLWFSLKYVRSFWFGFMAVLVLITSQGYVSIHGIRTGDYDALLTLFTTLYCLLFFLFLEEKKSKYLYLTFACAIAAVLTKGIAGLFFLPALFIYVIISKKLMTVLTNKHFYIGIGLFLVMVMGYYWLRDMQNPGYINAVFQNELGGRFNKAIEGHRGKPWFYYSLIINERFSCWHLLVPVGFLIGILSKKQTFRNLALFSALLVLAHFMVITNAETKLVWYDMPMYPFLAILVTLAAYFAFDMLVNWEKASELLKTNILPAVFLFLLFITPYREIIDKTYWPEEHEWDKSFDIGYVLKSAIDGKKNLDGYKIIQEGETSNWLFYTKMLKEKNQALGFHSHEGLQPGDKVIVSQGHLKQYIENHYDAEKLKDEKSVSLYLVHGQKNW